MRYTREYLELCKVSALRRIIDNIAIAKGCKSEDVAPKFSGRDLMIDSILDAQEEVCGS